MKTLGAAVTLGFAVLVQCCSAQEIKTVNQCRAYREAWVSSADSDTKELTVRELLQRAGQMITCGKEIDKDPVQSGMTATEALGTAIANIGYATLAANYYQEAFNRAAWFIDGKNLAKDFIAADDAKTRAAKSK